ncbi:TPA: hypothetical protein ACH63L_002780, partial [Staphylococcus aureus]
IGIYGFLLSLSFMHLLYIVDLTRFHSFALASILYLYSVTISFLQPNKPSLTLIICLPRQALLTSK